MAATRIDILRDKMVETQEMLTNVSAQAQRTSGQDVPAMQQQINALIDQLQGSLDAFRAECYEQNQRFLALEARLDNVEACFQQRHGGSSCMLSTGPPSTASSHPPSTVSAVSDHTLTRKAMAAAAAAAAEQRMRSAQAQSPVPSPEPMPLEAGSGVSTPQRTPASSRPATPAAHVQNDVHPIEEHPQAHEFCGPCIAAGVHTAYFNEWLDPDEVASIDATCSTRHEDDDYTEGEAYDKFWPFNSRLGSMLCGISSDGSGGNPICTQMEEAAAQGFFFCWGKHKTNQNSNTKANNASWVGCETCCAKLQVAHPGLPATKMGRKAVERVNLAFVNFFFGEEEIRRNRLRTPGKCALEVMYRGSVLTNDDDKDWRNQPKPRPRQRKPEPNRGGEGN